MKKTTAMLILTILLISGVAHAQTIDVTQYGSCAEVVQAIYQKINIIEQELTWIMRAQHQVYVRPQLPTVDQICNS